MEKLLQQYGGHNLSPSSWFEQSYMINQNLEGGGCPPAHSMITALSLHARLMIMCRAALEENDHKMIFHEKHQSREDFFKLVSKRAVKIFHNKQTCLLHFKINKLVRFLLKKELFNAVGTVINRGGRLLNKAKLF